MKIIEMILLNFILVGQEMNTIVINGKNFK